MSIKKLFKRFTNLSEYDKLILLSDICNYFDESFDKRKLEKECEKEFDENDIDEMLYDISFIHSDIVSIVKDFEQSSKENELNEDNYNKKLINDIEKDIQILKVGGKEEIIKLFEKFDDYEKLQILRDICSNVNINFDKSKIEEKHPDMTDISDDTIDYILDDVASVAYNLDTILSNVKMSEENKED